MEIAGRAGGLIPTTRSHSATSCYAATTTSLPGRVEFGTQPDRGEDLWAVSTVNPRDVFSRVQLRVHGSILGMPCLAKQQDTR